MILTNTTNQIVGNAILSLILLWLIGVGILLGTVALITWVIKKVWNAGKEPKKPAGERYDSSDWLSKAQQRQNKRYEYTDPASRPRPQKGAQKRENEPNWYPSGWTWNEEKQLWEPPDFLNKESAKKWTWDSSKQIWVDEEKERRLERYRKYHEGREPTFEEWKAQREKEQ